MSSVFKSFQATNQALPLSQTNPKEQGIRRRLSSLSLRIQPISSPASSWTFPRSKSMASIGESAGTSVRNWWNWGWTWILSKKPIFARDLEMNEEESAMLGCQNKGSWRHVLYKVRSELRRLMGSSHVGLPQTIRYDAYSYSQNFSAGKKMYG